MEPTRVAQFDDMMYGDYLALSDDRGDIDRWDAKEYEYNLTLSDRIFLFGWVLGGNSFDSGIKAIEQSIADSHDITKSNFGFSE